jgi:hypothetical protein
MDTLKPVKTIVYGWFKAMDYGLGRALSMIPFLLFLYYFPLTREALWEILHLNPFFIFQWYETNKYGTKIIWLFFTNKTVFSALWPLVLILVIAIIFIFYIFYRTVWCTFFKRYLIRQDNDTSSDGRIYWTNTGLFGAIGRKLRSWSGAKAPINEKIFWVNMRGYLNLIYPFNSMTKIIVPEDAKVENFLSSVVVHEPGVRVLSMEGKMRVLRAVPERMKAGDILNEGVNQRAEMSLQRLVGTASQSVHGDTVVSKKLLLDAGIVIPADVKEVVNLAERKRKERAGA